MPETPAIGIHRDIPFEAYRLLDAVNMHTLALFRRTPAHARWALTHPEEDTPALRLGDATHTALLEPERFDREYVAAPKFDKRTIRGKADAAAWVEAHREKVALSEDELANVLAMRSALMENPLARDLMSGPGQNEIVAVWRDAETNLLCKGRIDRLVRYRDWTFLVDLKTVRDASDRAWRFNCTDYAYHWQTAFYLDGCFALAPCKRRFIHVVIEKNAPYCSRVFEFDDSAIEEGRQQYKRALREYDRCMTTGEWPGYAVGIEAVDLPPWAHELTRPD
jgi:exodeoxyribonuclease VIII